MPTFTPPSTEYSYPSDERLWMFFRSSRHGVSVIRWLDGTFTAVETVTTDDFDEASFIYLGGHIYEVSGDEADALTAAGYGAGITADLIPGDVYTDPYGDIYGTPGVPGTPAPPYDPPPGPGLSDSGYGSGGYGEIGYGA